MSEKTNTNKKDYQVKNFSFTWNNYQNTANYAEIIENFAKAKCSCLFYGKEIAPKTGTPHLQGYMQTINKVRPSTIVNHFGKLVYVEPAKKCRVANYRYCSKIGEVWCYDAAANFCGILTNEQKEKMSKKTPRKVTKENESKYKECIKLAKQGKMEEILTYYPHIYLQYKDKLMAIRNDISKHDRMFLDNEFGTFFHCFFLWLWGTTGTGKSYFCTVFLHVINAFYKSLSQYTHKKYEPLTIYYKNKNKWWDRYNNEDIIIIEEASPETMKTSAHYYKQWIDEYPFNPEVKGATLNYIRPKFFIITSNYSLQQCFTDPTTNALRYEDYDPLNRRLCQIHLTKRQLPNWPNLHLLTTYEYTLDFVKYKWNNHINDLIIGLNINNNIGDTVSKIDSDNKDLTEYSKRKIDNVASTSEQSNKKIKPFTEEEIIDIENNVELNDIKGKNEDISEDTNTDITNETIDDNENSDCNEPTESDETPTYTVMMLDKITETTEDYCCIKCKKPSTGLFCKDCAKIQIEYENHAMCNECHRFFTALIDSHCPECTIKLKEEYKKSKEIKNIDETRLTPENAIPIKDPETPEKPKLSSWIEWEDTIISCNLYNIQSQVNWLYDNIFIDTKNFYFYQKKHNTIPSLLMIRMAIKLKMSKVMTIQKQYENKVGMDGKKSSLISFLKLDEETLKKRNSTYKNIIIQQKTIYSKLNRCLYTNGQKLLNLDNNLKLKAFRNIYDVSDYLTKNNHKTITINYLDKEILDDLINNKE